MNFFSGTWHVLRNKYFISIALFLVWMLFFDPKDWVLIHDRQTKLNELEKSEAHLTMQIKETEKELSQLKTNAQTIEKYAREKFHLKKENEDLYLVNSEEKK